MKTLRVLSVTMLLAMLANEGLLAQRRSSGGSSGGDTRRTPSSSGGSSSGGSSSRGSSGGSTSRGTSSSSGGTRASSGGRDRDGGTTTTSSGGQVAPREQGSSGTSASAERRGGKIGTIRRDADRAVANNRRVVYVTRGVYIGSCWECDYWGWYGGRWGWYHGGWWYPSRRPYHDPDRGADPEYEAPGQGYDEYPYADADDESVFVRSRTFGRRSFGAVSGQFFDDAGSDTRAGRFGIEGARGLLRGELEYAFYEEPATPVVDRMHSFRLAVGVQPRLGPNAYLVAAVGVRGIHLNNGGQSAGGPEGELGLQVFPVRPIGVNVTGRAAIMQWEGSTEHFGLRELTTTGSVFLNRFELQGGWHWLKVGDSPAFGGPVAGVRVWF